MAYGIPGPGREREGRRVGGRPSNLHDRVRFPYRPPSEPSNVALLRPSLFDAVLVAIWCFTSRRLRGVRYCYSHYHHDDKRAMSGTVSPYVPLVLLPPLHSTQAGWSGWCLYNVSPIPGTRVAWVHICRVFTQWRLLETYLPRGLPPHDIQKMPAGRPRR